MRSTLASHRGREIKTAGDGFMATFRSALDAVRFAVAVLDAGPATSLQIRVGVHAGEPIADGDDIFGTSVNLASRLCGAAAPDEIVVSDVVRALIGRRGAFAFGDAGPLQVKGTREPVRAFRLRRAGDDSAPAPSQDRGRSSERPPPAMARAERTMLCPVLVEREQELSTLANAVSAAAAGSGGVTVLAGGAGIGKTRLARDAGDGARRRGMTVLVGRAVPSQNPVPFRPLTGALLAAFRDGGPPRSARLAGFEGQLGRLVPEWRGETTGGADESPILLGEAVARALVVAGRAAGCVLLLEDLHWADPETLAVVEYLADALEGQPVLCLCTARPEGAVVETLARLRRHPSVTVLGLEPLSTLGVERVVAACLDTHQVPGEVAACIESNSEGNPFLVEELLAGLVAAGALRQADREWTATGLLTPSVPFDFATSLRQRLAPLDATARHVLRAGALLGRRFEWELLPGIAEVDGRAVLDALRSAVDEQIIETDGDGFRFRHALTREAVLAELLPPERRLLAQRAGPAVDRAHPGLPGPWLELASDLAEAAGDPATAARHLVESAARALDSGALTSAETTATRARALAASDPGVLDDAEALLVRILVLAGKPEQGAAVGDELLARLADDESHATRRAELLIVLARGAVTGGDNARAHSLIDDAQSLLDRGAVDDRLGARLATVAADIAFQQGHLDEARRLADDAVRLAHATEQPDIECEALEVLGRVARHSGGDWKAAFERAAGVAEQHGLVTSHLRARHELALMQAYMAGDPSGLLEVREAAKRNGALVTVAVMNLALSEIALDQFDREACLDHAQQCVAASRQFRLATLPVAHLWLAGAHALADDEAAMEAAASDALAADPDDPRILGDLWGRVRATLAMVADDRERLRFDLDQMMTFVSVAPVTTSIFPNRLVWALLHTVEDDDHGAAARAELAASTYLSTWSFFSLASTVFEAIALGRRGASIEATAMARPALATLNSISASTARGVAMYQFMLIAEAAIRDGWGEPVAWLREAEAFFSEGGYGRIARRCRTLLGAAGAPVPRRRGESVVPARLRAAGITSRELDVLNLVAEGLTNRQIAERLVVSPKTVERHVASLFDRTGVRKRADLVRWLADRA